ncbi:LytR/AlgR family response regulator transcription factor [Psychrobium sp. nBUS_13]|uniref:LytR/AlgR family response regulator transcription factor n=1 Tax=Psychrobium sp. nBUS_13 TaxID=3395319 RepID=UPI003EC00A48
MQSNKRLSVIVVDDEPLAIEGLMLRLEQIPEVEVIGQACNGDEAIKMCQELCPDVMFIDFKMPGLNGVEVVQAIQNDVIPLIVFVSAYGEFALDAFELNAIDYVLKPANLGRLKKTIDRILAYQQPNDNSKEKLLKALEQSSGIAISTLEKWLETDAPLPNAYSQELVIKNDNNERLLLPITDIRWIDAAGDYMCIHTPNETHIIRITMKKLAANLDPNVFVRIHKSTLVNIEYIRSVKSLKNSECIIALDEEVNLKVSRNYSAQIHEHIKSKQV